jgi:hypothetical protein
MNFFNIQLTNEIFFRQSIGPLHFNYKISTLQPHFKKIETAKNCFYKNNGTIRASTSSFYASSNIISDLENILMVDGTPRQFRMKLPDTKLVALVAVGVRYIELFTPFPVHIFKKGCNLKEW